MGCNKVLQEKGYRLTPQRIMVLDARHIADQHISAEEIYTHVRARYPYANISTVYRTLELLKELGLVIETGFGDGRVRYHPVEKGHHHHLVCQKCGSIIDLPESELSLLEDSLHKNYKFQANLKHLAIFGLCAGCRK